MSQENINEITQELITQMPLRLDELTKAKGHVGTMYAEYERIVKEVGEKNPNATKEELLELAAAKIEEIYPTTELSGPEAENKETDDEIQE